MQSPLNSLRVPGCYRQRPATKSFTKCIVSVSSTLSSVIVGIPPAGKTPSIATAESPRLLTTSVAISSLCVMVDRVVYNDQSAILEISLLAIFLQSV